MPERRRRGGGGGTDAAVTATTIRPGNATAKKLNGREQEGDGKKEVLGLRKGGQEMFSQMSRFLTDFFGLDLDLPTIGGGWGVDHRQSVVQSANSNDFFTGTDN